MEGFLRRWKHSSVEGELGLFCKPKPREAMMVMKPKSQKDDENEVSTELTLSCGGSQSRTNYGNKRKESKSTSSFIVTSTTNNEFLTENPEEEEEEVSTALTLFDESWYRNSLKRKSMENFASNSKKKQEERTVLSVSDLKDPTNNEFLTENPEEEEEVSTALTLFDESWYRNSLKRKNMENFASTSKKKQEERTVLSVSDQNDPTNNEFLTENPEEEEEVSTALTLFDESWYRNSLKRRNMENFAPNPKTKQGTWKTLLQIQKDPWEIKKILRRSDLGHMSRLLVHTHLVTYNILPYLDTECVSKIETKGVKFTVWDEDTKTMHQLVLMQRPRSKSYVFKTMWRGDFVKRRGLKPGDEIGFYWDSHNLMFHFSVLKRAGV